MYSELVPARPARRPPVPPLLPVTLSKAMAVRSLALLCVSLLAGCSGGSPDAGHYQPDYNRGLTLYNAQCGSCHEDGRLNAPSIHDQEEWDPGTLSRPGVMRQHLAMNWLSAVRSAPLSEYDEADVLFYLQQELGKAESSY